MLKIPFALAAALAANSKAPLVTSDADFAHVEKQVTIL